MRAVQSSVVVALGLAALSLSFGVLWFFDVHVSPMFNPPETILASQTDTCDEVASVIDGRALNQAFPDAHLTDGDQLCLTVEDGGVTTVRAITAADEDDVLFGLEGRFSPAGLQKIGLRLTA